MQDLLLEVHAAEPTTILLVTHDVEEALYLADRVVLLGTPGEPAQGSVRRVIAVPGTRPRDRASTALAELRAELLEGLGVHSHHSPRHGAEPTPDPTAGATGRHRPTSADDRPVEPATRTAPSTESTP
jgi:sulfonate transport system ATP-binding protein